MSARLKCSVPGCNRTCPAGDHAEWVCGKHWPAVSRNWRQRYTRLKRRARRDDRWIPAAARMWVRCRDEAIAQALMGL